jgi:hypothetical protein
VRWLVDHADGDDEFDHMTPKVRSAIPAKAIGFTPGWFLRTLFLIDRDNFPSMGQTSPRTRTRPSHLVRESDHPRLSRSCVAKTPRFDFEKVPASTHLSLQ